MEEPNKPPPLGGDSSTMSFNRAILFEGSLIIIAAILAWIFGVPLLADFNWEWKATLLGLSSTLPLLAFFAWLLQSDYPAFIEVRDFLNTFVVQVFGKWSVLQLAALSVTAGIGEEILFRGVLQPGMSQWTSPVIGLLIASFAFAVCHALTKAYFISTFVIGIYLSIVWQAADNLLAPIVTHAVYDFLALLYFMKWLRPKDRAPEKEEADK